MYMWGYGKSPKDVAMRDRAADVSVSACGREREKFSYRDASASENTRLQPQEKMIDYNKKYLYLKGI